MSKFIDTQYGPVRVVEVKDEGQPPRYYFEQLNTDALGAAKWDEIPERGDVILIPRSRLAAFHLNATGGEPSIDPRIREERDNLLEAAAEAVSQIRNLAPNCRAANRAKLEKIATALDKTVDAAILGPEGKE